MYLIRTKSLARKFVAHKLGDQPYSPEDLDPAAGPLLVTADLANEDHVDVVTDEGCIAAGLPDSYPRDSAGETISHQVCWPIGQAAWDTGEPGIACRSASRAAATTAEELAWFQRADTLIAVDKEAFSSWFFGAE